MNPLQETRPSDSSERLEYKAVFFNFSKEAYTEEYKRVERINRRAFGFIALFSVICGAIYNLSSLDYISNWSIAPYYFFLGTAWISAISGMVLLFLVLLPKGHVNQATTNKWLDWIKKEEANGQQPSTITANFYDYMSADLTDGQSQCHKNNEKRFRCLRWSQYCLAVTLVAILGTALFKADIDATLNKKGRPNENDVMLKPAITAADSPTTAL